MGPGLLELVLLGVPSQQPGMLRPASALDRKGKRVYVSGARSVLVKKDTVPRVTTRCDLWNVHVPQFC